MSPTELIGAVGAVLAAVFVPVYVQVNQRRQERANAGALSVESAAKMFREERDRLQTRLDQFTAQSEARVIELQAANERAITAAEAKWQRQHDADQVQIAQFQREINSLYKALFERGTTHP